MARKLLQISFDEDWILAHKDDFGDYPVAYLVNSIEEDFPEMHISRVTPSYCRLFWESNLENRKIEEAFGGYVKDKLRLPVLGHIAVLSVEDAAAAEGARGVPPKAKTEPKTKAEPKEKPTPMSVTEPDMPASTGEKPSIGELVERTLSVRAKVLEKVMGQMHAAEAFTEGMFAMQVHKDDGSAACKPRAFFLFAGPPGVGKTYLAETVASLMGLPFLRLDMSGFSDGQVAVESFRGINRSYKDASAGKVTSFVEENPECLLLFDEIEKAHPLVVQLFLQILDGARCRDGFTDREVSFEKAVIIMTTNAGRGLYEDTEKRNFSDVSDRMVVDALKKDVDARGEPYFPAALLSRLAEGTIVMFNHLEPYALCEIVGAEMKRRSRSYREQFGLAISFDDDIPAALLYAEGGSSDARTLKGSAKSLIDSEMLDLLQLEGAQGLREVRFTLDKEGAEEDARALFEQGSVPEALVFCAGGALPDGGTKEFRLRQTSEPEKAKEMLRRGVDCVLIDVTCGSRAMRYLPGDLEDFDADGVDLFRYVREYYESLPVYLLHTGRAEGADAYRSFIRSGARDVIPCCDGPCKFRARLRDVCRNALLGRASLNLSRLNKALSFNCAQVFPEEGKAEIKLSALRLRHNVAAEDAASILSGSGRPGVRFSDVVGAREAKEELKEFISYLKDPRAYLAGGARAPRGVLLYGPPGTGKTLLAKAMAGESDVTFIQKNATEFYRAYVGEGPRSVREAFRLARKYAPAVLFVDEVDAVGKMRTGSETMHAMEELQNTFLSEMDGFTFDENRPVFVLAATNYSVDGGGPRTLDPAFVRRFDRKIKIDLPDTEERAQFLQYYLLKHGIRHIKKETVENVAARSIGRSPADLELVVELAIRTMQGKPLTDAALAEALDADRFGKKREWTEETVRKTSYHEAGHAVVNYVCGGKPTYVTNISRGGYGGYMLPEVDDKKFGFTRQELLDDICCALGGRAAELVFYGEEAGMTTGASGDLVNATQTARSIVCRYGMDGSLLALSGEELEGTYGEKTLARMENILQEQLGRAETILRENSKGVEALVEALMLRNSLTGTEIADILKRAGCPCGSVKK